MGKSVKSTSSATSNPSKELSAKKAKQIAKRPKIEDVDKTVTAQEAAKAAAKLKNPLADVPAAY